MDKVLVLNADYSPLNVTTLHRGFNLVFTGKAEIVKSSDNLIVTDKKSYERPVIIRLLNYVRYVYRRLRVNRHKIYKRDGHKCVYCGNSKQLTIDHLIPKSKGGKNTWENLVTCCSRCNVKKGDKTIEQAGLKLLKKPYEPDIFIEAMNTTLEKVWIEYKNSF
jgi:5-methylcytosine-specific restriction endonuclease McrA